MKLVMGRVYAVHTSVLQPLGLKLSGTIKAVFDDPQRTAEQKEIDVKEHIDKEIFAALGSIQQLLTGEVAGEEKPA